MNVARPILVSSCARAATADELRYRIDRPIAPRRGARVIALDEVAGRVVRAVAGQPWNAARFYVGAAGRDDDEITLRTAGGADTLLSEELVDADVAVMVAAADGNGHTASAIGQACARRGIMTAGVILGDARDVGDTVSALRPHARVLLVTTDEQDVSEMLTALRA